MMKQPWTFSLQPLHRENDMGKEVRVCDEMDALAYKVAEHCLWPWEGQREREEEKGSKKKEEVTKEERGKRGRKKE